MNYRNQSLDVLRGFAVLMVICCHYPYFQWMQAGWIGVDLFFVLSGFLISGLLFTEIMNTGGLRVGRFLLRRSFKIYPSLVVFLALTCAISKPLREHLLVQSLFLQSYYPPRGTPWLHTWSLAVEEHFYLALPLVLLLLLRRNRMHLIPWLTGSLLIICFIARLPIAGLPQPTQTHARVDSLFAGVFLGYLFHFHSQTFKAASRPVLPAMVALLLLPAFLARPMQGLSISLVIACNTVAFALLILWAVPRTLPVSSGLAWIGRRSYSIYLWHLPILWIIRSRPMTMLGFTEAVSVSVFVGIVMAQAVELPMLRLRERFSADQKIHRIRLNPTLAPPATGEGLKARTV